VVPLAVLLACDSPDRRRTSPSGGSAVAVSLSGACDGSAAVDVDGTRILVGNDEDNVLRVYDVTSGGAPTATFDLSSLLALPEPTAEADIEGAAAIGDTVLWITSHSSGQAGRPRPNRYRLFATLLDRSATQPVTTLVGAAVGNLLDAMAADSSLARLLAGRSRGSDVRGAVNIEGLAFAADGTLLIGFRTPLVGGRALIVPLRRPLSVLRGTAPSFGAPVLLDLGGRGIRGIEWSEREGAFYVVAGALDGADTFAVFRWRGPPAAAGARVPMSRTPANLQPEALVLSARGALLLSDDGDRRVAGAPCREVPAPRRRFRAIRLQLPTADGTTPGDANGRSAGAAAAGAR
jgi:hypothetical protein